MHKPTEPADSTTVEHQVAEIGKLANEINQTLQNMKNTVPSAVSIKVSQLATDLTRLSNT